MQEDKAFIFYDWRDVGVGKVQYSQSEHVKSKLHGKIIHFKTKSEKNFVYLEVQMLRLKV